MLSINLNLREDCDGHLSLHHLTFTSILKKPIFLPRGNSLDATALVLGWRGRCGMRGSEVVCTLLSDSELMSGTGGQKQPSLLPQAFVTFITTFNTTVS